MKPILWVEDDPDDQALIASALEELGWGGRVQFADDGEQALAALMGSPQPPRVIFLDFKLPKMDAPEVLERLRGDPRFDTVPVIIFTSSKSPLDAARCTELGGAASFVSKPTDYDDLRLTVRRLIERWAPAL